MVKDDAKKKVKTDKDKKEIKKKSTSDGAQPTDAEVEAEVEKLLKSGVWKEMKQESTGKTYYYHSATKKTCWDLKKEVAKQLEAEGGSSSTPSTAKAAATEQPAAKPAKEEAAASKPSKKAAATTAEASTTSAARPAKGGELVPTSGESNTLRSLDSYKDPLERLVDETAKIEQLLAATGASESMAAEFQRSYEALARTNKALTVQMAKMKVEYDAMQKALKDANEKIYEQDGTIQQLRKTEKVGTKQEESDKTLSFLREQNRDLVRQLGEMSVLLSRGLNEMSYRVALNEVGNVPPEQMVANPPQLLKDGQAPAEPLGVLVYKVLENPVLKKWLCSTCSTQLEKLRDSLMPSDESNVILGGNENSAASGYPGPNAYQQQPQQQTYHHPQQQQQQQQSYHYPPAQSGSGGYQSNAASQSSPYTQQAGSQPQGGNYNAPAYGSNIQVLQNQQSSMPPQSQPYHQGNGQPYYSQGQQQQQQYGGVGAGAGFRSESRASTAVSQSPVFGGFRLRGAA